MADIHPLLRPVLQELIPAITQKRERMMRCMTAAVIISTALITGSLYFMILSDMQAVFIPAILVSLLAALVLFAVLNGLYRKDVKRQVVGLLAARTDFTYHAKGVFNIADINRHKILPPHDNSRIEDGFDGTFNEVPLSVQEVHLSNMEVEGGSGSEPRRTRDMTIFWGVVARIRLKRPVEGHTVVISRNVMQTLFRTRFSAFERVRLVSPAFERRFDAMSTDQIEARVILNPAFMERFMEIGRILDARWMEVSFHGDEIVFAVQRFKNLFEAPPLWTPVTESSLRRTLCDLDSFLKITEALRRNRQIGL